MSFSLSLGNANARPRRERDNPTASQPDSLARLAYALRNRFFNRNPLGRARSAGAGGERGLSTRFSNHHKVSIRRQPRGSFGSNATLANRVTNTALSPALFGWASDSAALITLYYKLRSLSFAFSRRFLNISLAIVRQNKGGGLQTNLPTPTRLRPSL